MLTDKDIIKALECCVSLDKCDECPWYKYECKSGDVLHKHSLDLVNRLQAEIENYSHNVKQLAGDIRNYQIELQAMRNSANSFKSKYKSALDTAKELQSVIKEKDVEIERLQKAYKQCAWERDVFAEDMKEEIKKDCSYLALDIKTIKAEAIKEFAERLNEKTIATAEYCEVVLGQDIDNLVKEMVGEDE